MISNIDEKILIIMENLENFINCRIKKGDQVEILPNVNCSKFPEYSISGWNGRVESVLVEHKLVKIAYDEWTLKNIIPQKYKDLFEFNNFVYKSVILPINQIKKINI